MQCTVLLPATIPKIELVTPPKFSSTFLQPMLPQLTSRSQLTTTPRRHWSSTPRRHWSSTPRRHWSSTPRRHWYVKPRLQFTTLQPTLLKNTTLISKYYTTKALKYYTITYATTTCYTEAPKAVLLCPEFLLH
jgi:hypothetical protein